MTPPLKRPPLCTIRVFQKRKEEDKKVCLDFTQWQCIFYLEDSDQDTTNPGTGERGQSQLHTDFLFGQGLADRLFIESIYLTRMYLNVFVIF